MQNLSALFNAISAPTRPCMLNMLKKRLLGVCELRGIRQRAVSAVSSPFRFFKRMETARADLEKAAEVDRLKICSPED